MYWLVNHGHIDQAKQQLKTIAKLNRKKYNEDVIEKLLLEKETNGAVEQQDKKKMFLDYIRCRKTRTYLCVMCYLR